MPEQRPNVIVFVTDDQGIWAMGCAGNSEIRTPNLDRIARQGMRFENFFCVSPVCSPARASLLTGSIPSQHGVHDWIRGGNEIENAIDYLEGQVAYTDLLAAHGYVCGFSGKWHLGNSAKPRTGFQHWYTHQCGGGPYYNAPMYRDGKPINEPDYITDVITDDALDFITQNARGRKPFYASIHYTAPHSPWIDNHPKAIVDSYDDCPFESCPVEKEHPWALYNTVPVGVYKEPKEHLKGYFAAVTAMDANVGRVLDKLDELRITKNTLIFFTGDNGYNCGHHGIWGKGNGTFPLNMYDNSVKVPALISQPGAIPEGKVSSALLSHYDFMPTLMDYLGIEYHPGQSLPGKSFAPLLHGEELGDRQSIVVFDEYGPVRMIRTYEWKYVHRYPYGPNELYDLKNDPGERINLVEDKARQSIVNTMKEQLDAWFNRYVVPEVDGAREAVYGKGQLELAGLFAKGKKAFADDIT
jgi:choline-sulfatase